MFPTTPSSQPPPGPPGFFILVTLIFFLPPIQWGFPGGSGIKNPPAVQETRVRSLGRKDPLEEETAAHSNIFVCRMPCTEEPGGATVHGVTGRQTRLSLHAHTAPVLCVVYFILFFLPWRYMRS